MPQRGWTPLEGTTIIAKTLRDSRPLSLEVWSKIVPDDGADLELDALANEEPVGKERFGQTLRCSSEAGSSMEDGLKLINVSVEERLCRPHYRNQSWRSSKYCIE